MAIIIRPPDTTVDYAALADLQRYTTIDDQLVDPDQLQADDTQAALPTIRRRRIAVNPQNVLPNIVLGTSYLAHESWMSAGQFRLAVAVDPLYRQQGIGTLLYKDAVAHAQACGATEFVTTLRDDHAAETRAFAALRGFELQQHWVYWQLQLADFDEAPFLAALTQAQARGIRFSTFAEAGNTSVTQQKLYDLNRRTSLDAPGEDSFPSLEEFVRDIISADWFRPDAQIVAVDGEAWVGLSAVGIDGRRAFNAFTGVDRAYRQQGLAMALTLLAIRYARQQNATHLQVFNDSRNTPMFKLQEKLGYQRIPGRYMMKHTLTADSF